MTRKRDRIRDRGPVGRPTVYRGKNRNRPVQVALTDAGLEGLARGVAKSGLSRPDYIERLILRDVGMERSA